MLGFWEGKLRRAEAADKVVHEAVDRASKIDTASGEAGAIGVVAVLTLL